MSKKIKLIIGVCVWAVISIIAASAIIVSCSENKDGEIVYLDIEVKTGLFSYSVGGRCGLMDANCRRLTGPLYSRIIAVDKNMYRALLLDSYSEVILNSRGEVMK